MSTVHPQHTSDDLTAAQQATPEIRRRREDVDPDLVAILGMLAILALTVLCFLGRTALPL